MKNKYKYLSAKWQLLKLKRKIKEIQLNEKLLWNNLVDLKTKKISSRYLWFKWNSTIIRKKFNSRKNLRTR